MDNKIIENTFVDIPAHECTDPLSCLSYEFKREQQQQYILSMPSTIQKRVRALRKLQLVATNLEAEFHRAVYEVERTFEMKYGTIFDKRQAIVSGNYEPNEEECDFPDIDYKHDRSLNLIQNQVVFDNNSKGIPGFWLNIFKYVPLFESYVKESDEDALMHLMDVRAITKPVSELSFTLEFHFSPNEYFENTILTKDYYLKCSPDTDDPFSFDGPEIYKCQGCKINWHDGKNLTIKNVKKRIQNPEKDTIKTVKADSFFNFFDPPGALLDENDPQFNNINDILENDFEFGHYLKERIIPRAVLYFSGESSDFSESTSDTDSFENCDGSQFDEDVPGMAGEGDAVENSNS